MLENVPGIDMNEAEKNKVLGEARFFPTRPYFYAVCLWGDIPLIKLTQSANAEEFLPVRSPRKEVYNLIVADLMEAKNAGLPWVDESGRVSQSAV